MVESKRFEQSHLQWKKKEMFTNDCIKAITTSTCNKAATNETERFLCSQIHYKKLGNSHTHTCTDFLCNQT